MTYPRLPSSPGLTRPISKTYPSLGNFSLVIFFFVLFLYFSLSSLSLIAKSMALLSTGNPKLSEARKRSGVLVKRDQENLDEPVVESLSVFCDIDRPTPSFLTGENLVDLQESLDLLDKDDCPHLGSFSPFSDHSTDSGVQGSSLPTFLDGHQSPSGLSDFLNDASSCVTEFSLRVPVAEGAKIAAGGGGITAKSRKNAEAARQNRIKKKQYLEELEKERSTLKIEKVVLKTRCQEFQRKCQLLQEKVEYLENVLANESTLASLIKNIPQIPDVKLTSSFLSRKRPNPGLNTADTNSKRRVTPGVCLHVSEDVVSLELCHNCSKAAHL